MSEMRIDSKELRVLLFLSVLINGLVPAGQYLGTAPLPLGRVSEVVTSLLIAIGPLAILPGLMALGIVPLSAIAIFWAPARRLAAVLLLFSVFHLVAAAASFKLSFEIRHNAFVDLAKRSEPLVDALHAYREKYGRAPDDKAQLIPEFLPAWPETGMAAYPEYRYVVPSDKSMYEGNEWILEVRASNGVMNWDSFLYFPDQNYPSFGYGGVYERMGEWAYVHE